MRGIPPPPPHQKRRPVKWTRHLCSFCGKYRTMPVKATMCGYCQEIEVKIRDYATKEDLQQVNDPEYAKKLWHAGSEYPMAYANPKYLDRLHDARVKRRMKIRHLADEMAMDGMKPGRMVTTDYIRRAEDLEHRVGLLNRVRMARVLGVEPDDLWTEAGQDR